MFRYDYFWIQLGMLILMYLLLILILGFIDWGGVIFVNKNIYDRVGFCERE